MPDSYKFRIEFRGQTFDLHNEGKTIKNEPSWGAVGLGRDFLDETIFQSVDTVSGIPVQSEMTREQIDILTVVEKTVNFLVFKGAKILESNFPLKQVRRHV